MTNKELEAIIDKLENRVSKLERLADLEHELLVRDKALELAWEQEPCCYNCIYVGDVCDVNCSEGYSKYLIGQARKELENE